jgi:glucan 1,3-beta-glucosidase
MTLVSHTYSKPTGPSFLQSRPACSNNPGPENCQNNILSLEGSLNNIEIYCLNTVGTTNMIVQNGAVLAEYSDNINVYPDTIALFQAAATANNWVALGCYTDSISARTLANYIVVPGGPGATTIEACLATCNAAGYSLAGVEFSQECCKPSYIPPLNLPPSEELKK